MPVKHGSRKSDKKIQVKARKLSAGNTTLTISDNGEGILPDVLDKIFVPFFTTKNIRFRYRIKFMQANHDFA